MIRRDTCRDDWSVGDQREVNAGIWHQVSLELVQIYVEGTVEPEGGGNAGHDLSNQSVQVGITRALDIQIPAADIIDGLVVDHESAVGVLEGGVSSEDGVVRLNHGGGDLRRGVDRKFEL